MWWTMLETDKCLNGGRIVMNYKCEVLCINIVTYCENTVQMREWLKLYYKQNIPLC